MIPVTHYICRNSRTIHRRQSTELFLFYRYLCCWVDVPSID